MGKAIGSRFIVEVVGCCHDVQVNVSSCFGEIWIEYIGDIENHYWEVGQRARLLRPTC